MKGRSICRLSAVCFLLICWGLKAPLQALAAEPDLSATGVRAGEIDTARSSDAMVPESDDPSPGTVLRELHVAGGMSAGEFYASNSGPDVSDNEIIVSNILFELSAEGNEHPIAFEAAVGETSTPSLLNPPETATDLDLEYASLSLTALPGTTIEAGLLKPDAGFEDTYTFNNANVVLGQQCQCGPRGSGFPAAL